MGECVATLRTTATVLVIQRLWTGRHIRSKNIWAPPGSGGDLLLIWTSAKSFCTPSIFSVSLAQLWALPQTFSFVSLLLPLPHTTRNSSPFPQPNKFIQLLNNSCLVLLSGQFLFLHFITSWLQVIYWLRPPDIFTNLTMQSYRKPATSGSHDLFFFFWMSSDSSYTCSCAFYLFIFQFAHPLCLGIVTWLHSGKQESYLTFAL